ncbi:hypothetical protein EPO34_00615 [Patescibacteria group bacterium]|nr:MAG: hypothetical protein EPO34_00615 [Patescibacteria group bacterium]
MNVGRVLPLALAASTLVGAGCVSVDASKQTVHLDLDWHYGPAVSEAAEILSEAMVTPPKVTIELGARQDPPKAE